MVNIVDACVVLSLSSFLMFKSPQRFLFQQSTQKYLPLVCVYDSCCCICKLALLHWGIFASLMVQLPFSKRSSLWIDQKRP